MFKISEEKKVYTVTSKQVKAFKRRRRLRNTALILIIIIIGSIAGYYIYQSVRRPKEDFESIDLSFSQWKHTTNYEDVRFYQELGNLVLENTDPYHKISAFLRFPDITIGKMKLRIRSDEILFQTCFLHFKMDSTRVFDILRALDGSYWFSIEPISKNFQDGDAYWHDYYVEWDFSGENKVITVKFDYIVILEDYTIVKVKANSINNIEWKSLEYHSDTKMYIDVSESYLRSYV